MGLFCLACGVYSYRNVHKCSTPISSLIPLSPVCKGIALKLYHLGLEPLSAGCFVTPVPESLYDHRITFDIEFRDEIPPILALPAGWSYYTQIVGTDFQISVIGYSEVYTWDGVRSPSNRCQEVAELFVEYLSSLDKAALDAIKTLYIGGFHYAK